MRDRLILHAIHEAYRNILPGNVFPATLLFLEMPYDEVDVNVHPAKIEVRFRRSQFVHDFTRDSIRQVLMNARAVPSFAAAAGAGAAATSSNGAFGMSPVTAATQASPYPDSTGDAAQSQDGAPQNSATAHGVSIPHANIPPLGDIGIGSGVGSDGGFELTGAPLPPRRSTFLLRLCLDFRRRPRFLVFGSAGILPAFLPSDGNGTNWAANFSTATDAPGRLPHPEEIADLKPLGQVSASFIIAVNGEGLWIVDQHVAHERILFEQHLEARRAGKVESQRMLMPIILELAPRQLVIYEKIAEELTANGFEVEPMGPRSVAIQAIPAGVTGNDAEKLLTEILDGIERENAAISIETLQAKIAASTACHAAIKVNMPLDQTKMEWLLATLAKTDCPMSCPHGRPVVLRYSVKEIERAFHRIYDTFAIRHRGK